MSKKISSVLELARYKPGDQVFQIAVFYPCPVPQLSEEDGRYMDCHPKDLFAGPFKQLWPFSARLPKLSHCDFDLLINVLISKLQVVDFVISGIIRSDQTGEFMYSEDEDWIPENCLFDTMVAASREKSRILRLFKNWAKRNA